MKKARKSISIFPGSARAHRYLRPGFDNINQQMFLMTSTLDDCNKRLVKAKEAYAMLVFRYGEDGTKLIGG